MKQKCLQIPNRIVSLSVNQHWTSHCSCFFWWAIFYCFFRPTSAEGKAARTQREHRGWAAQWLYSPWDSCLWLRVCVICLSRCIFQCEGQPTRQSWRPPLLQVWKQCGWKRKKWGCGFFFLSKRRLKIKQVDKDISRNEYPTLFS